MFNKLPVLVLLSLCLACTKNKQEWHREAYVPGDVLVGIKMGVPIDTAFAVFNRYGLKIQEINSFVYTAPYPQAKRDSIAAYLDTKPYIDSANWKVKFAYNQRWNKPVYFNHFVTMDASAQEDWLRTAKDLQLDNLQDSFATAYLKVPVGTEKFWVEQLSKNSIIRWVEPNKILFIEE